MEKGKVISAIDNVRNNVIIENQRERQVHWVDDCS